MHKFIPWHQQGLSHFLRTLMLLVVLFFYHLRQKFVVLICFHKVLYFALSRSKISCLMTFTVLLHKPFNLLICQVFCLLHIAFLSPFSLSFSPPDFHWLVIGFSSHKSVFCTSLLESYFSRHSLISTHILFIWPCCCVLIYLWMSGL